MRILPLLFLSHLKRMSRQVDTYSFAMFLYELLTCDLPYRNSDERIPKGVSGGAVGVSAGGGVSGDLRTAVTAGLRPLVPRSALYTNRGNVADTRCCPSRLLDCTALCWHPDPKQRPSMSTVCKFLDTKGFGTLR